MVFEKIFSMSVPGGGMKDLARQGRGCLKGGGNRRGTNPSHLPLRKEPLPRSNRMEPICGENETAADADSK